MNRRVVRVRGSGGPEVLHIETEPLRAPRAGEVLVAVSRAGVAFGDVMRRRGVLAPPSAFVPGYDIAGTVIAAGTGSTVATGSRVVALMPRTGFGGYADHVILGADTVARVPDGVDDDTAIALGLNYITAHQLLERFAPLSRGHAVLVHGAGGGVGQAVLDLSRRAGLRVYGTASAPKHEAVRALGGIPIDYRSVDFVEVLREAEPDGVDVVIDGIGGQHLQRSAACIRRGGTLVALGVSGDVGSGLLGVLTSQRHYLGLKLWPNGIRVKQYAIGLSRGCSPAACRDDWSTLLGLAADGEIAPRIGAVFPLEAVREAHASMDAASRAGKILLSMEH